MTTLVPIDSILIDRDNRQRRELQDIPELAESIQRIGILHPPVVERTTMRLIVGERRLTAMRSLGWTEVPVTFREELDPGQLQVIELEENIKRKDLVWQDTVAAVTKYHRLRAEEAGGDWSIDKTAAALGVATSFVQSRMIIQSEIERGNEMVINAPKKSTAYGIALRARERRGDEGLAAITANVRPPSSAAAPAPAPEPDILEALVEADPSPTPFTELLPSRSGMILNEDFNEWAPTYRGKPFNLIHCDFPYGINADKFNQGSASAHGGYADSPEVYWRLIDTLNNHIDKIAAESSHLIFWFSMDFYEETYALLSKSWRVDRFPLIWYKSDGRGILPDPNRGPRRNYETAFFGSRGDRKIVRAVSNVSPAPITSGTHMSEKTQTMLEHFFRMLVDESSSVLDPTCGSGSALRAAHRAGAGRVLGLEVNPEFAELADEKLQAVFDEESH